MTTDRVRGTDADRPGLLQMIAEVVDLSAALGILLLPLLVTAVPGIILFLVLPAVLLLAVAVVPVALSAAVAGPAYLLVRSVRRRRRVG
jgi:hypothetical protein